MANTKTISDKKARKSKKRELRKAHKVAFAGLSQKQKKAFKKAEPRVGLRKFLADTAA